MPENVAALPDVADAERQLIARGIDGAAPAFSAWHASIAKRIAGAGDPTKADDALTAWAETAANDPAIIEPIYESALLANMTARLQLLAELPGSRALSRFALAADGSSPSGSGGPSINFAALPFEQAVADFRARGVVTPEEYAAMEREARQRSFTATRFASETLRDEAHAALLSALENGDSYASFVRALRDGSEGLGISESDPAYLDLVFRTNIASATAAGRFEQGQSASVMASHPLVQFRAIMDGRTTTQCRFCNGLVFDRVNDPGWVTFAPPLHFNCRSTTVYLPRSSAQASRLIRSSDVDPRGYPAPGFGGAPSLGLAAE